MIVQDALANWDSRTSNDLRAVLSLRLTTFDVWLCQVPSLYFANSKPPWENKFSAAILLLYIIIVIGCFD